MNNREFNEQEMMMLRRRMQEELTREEMDELIQNIYLSIEAELRDSAYYRALARIAPDQFAEEMIMEFSRDEREHAFQLQQAYEALTGKTFYPPEEGEYNFDINNFNDALETRIYDETADYKKYKKYYLMTNNRMLRDIFFNAMIDESYHALREFYLLHLNMMM